MTDVGIVLVGIIVGIVVVFQVYFFWKNLAKMCMFRNIFSSPYSWTVNGDNGTVYGIDGQGNDVFNLIKSTINDYLSHSRGSVIDYNILKDAVDRNCETIEDEINSQMPVPLYCGLAGTMAGVIIGLFGLLSEDAITGLLNGGTSSSAAVAMGGAANGINSLLAGVAMAMIASILGILLTTVNSVLFKRFRRAEETGKNKFLSWMQSVLLPQLPNNISDSFSRFVGNLNRFNSTFRENTNGLNETLARINEASSIQADIVSTIQHMDVRSMATANVRVLRELNACTDRLEQFNVYLNSVQGYTAEIEAFRRQLRTEGQIVSLLEEIKNFFHDEFTDIQQRRLAISQSVDNVDETLGNALHNLSQTSATSLNNLQQTMDRQTQELQEFLEREKQMLQDESQEMLIEFERQISQLPNLSKRLEDITQIPGQLQEISRGIADANTELVSGIQQSNRSMTDAIMQAVESLKTPVVEKVEEAPAKQYMPTWMKVVVVSLLFVIAGAAVANTWISYHQSVPTIQQDQTQTTTESVNVRR